MKLSKLTTTQKVGGAVGILALGYLGWKFFANGGSSPTNPNYQEIIVPQTFPDPLAQQYFNVVRDAINNGTSVVYNNKVHDARTMTEQNMKQFNRTPQQSAAAFATWAVKQNFSISPA